MIVLVAVGVGVAASLGVAPAGPALSEADLGKLIELRIDDGAIVARVREVGLGFVIDEAALGRLKRAGGSGPVLDAVRQAAPAATAPASAPAPAVTYDDVLTLLRLGIGEDQVLRQVQASPTLFTLGPAQVERLKRAGASTRLLAAMQGDRAPAAGVGDVTDFAIILDCSGSMRERTREGSTKMETAKSVVTELIRKIPDGLRLTFVAYGRDTARQCRSVDVVRELSTLDAEGKSELIRLIAGLQPVGATPIALALRTAGQELAKNDAYRGLVLITDGKETCQGDPAAEAAALARDPKLTFGIHVIGFDIQPVERAALEEIARAGKGEYHDARSGAELATALKSVGEELAAASLPPVASRGPVTIQERATLEGHGSAVSHVAFSPDGRRLASLSHHEVILWDVATGKARASFKLSEAGTLAHALAFAPDGRTLAIGDGDGLVRLLNAARGNLVGVLKGHASEVRCLAFSPDGRALVSGSDDRTARVWDVATGRRKLTLQGHEREVSGVAVSDDGRTLVTACYEGTARLWDAATGRPLLSIPHPADYYLKGVALSPDRRLLALAAAKPNGADVLRLVNADSGEQAASLDAKSNLRAVAFSPDGRLLVSGGDDVCVRLWDVAGEKELACGQEHLRCVNCVAFSPDGKTIASGSDDRTVKLWDVVPTTGPRAE